MSAKRKMPSLGLDRRVRPRKEDEWEPEVEDASDNSEDDSGSEQVHDEDEEEGSSEEEGSDAEAQEDPKKALASISFGALARAQASLPPSDKLLKKRKLASGGSKDAESEDDDGNDDKNKNKKKLVSKAEAAANMKRSSKHAPQEQSSKRPVSRRREVVPTESKRAPARDPRFDPLSTGRPGQFDEAKARRAYAFLDEYRDKELAELRAQVRKTKDPGLKEELKRQVLSMESKRKAQKRKDEEQALLAEHRRREKELVARGKQPFYLKKSEQKKQLLTSRFESMSKGQVDKAIARKRKKVAGKEKKELDTLQRVTDRRGYH
ncbi:ribosomal RNA-processing protein 36 [Geosmithia morbida]|uniref:rRNA biogenesis protein RRP36 n=1 Tax=Geosmithia morbida TaxID=1094350 RepID=A0A9P4YR16_9HYPO|nr:ribosomal RNA-processing protein 36 [Geosmithia morbida]KAF4120204.1 ribosomal RNA-processing protein 36 [Geosmithia morbida]